MNNLKSFFIKNWWLAIILIISVILILNYNSTKSKSSLSESNNKSNTEIKLPVAETITFGTWSPDGLRSVVGITESESNIDIPAELNGKISKIYVNMGDEVKAGQALASFDIQGDQTYINYQNSLNNLAIT
jgi:multidrug efflux pump subunit AcrA (membrane-fusion protein)